MDILVKVPDNKVEFFMELVQNLKFKAEPRVKSKAKSFTPEQQEWINDLKESLEEVELHQQGKIKLKSARELLDEL
ncbi:hypothetical protein EXU85_34155 [Spirosoma sp. KCTC 42546]|uniref:hypothetical protein n=1 Tax=Spirosoma sp. KCTC 42546 TaxID=2520506 RepID=UPI00115A2761|nr:hypothetical protein [Spirosoma sp. KCTC 42546]QDK83379.1 hypothetical protein EXU85_34155 [Spirosoma sp. KCTC 42546]